MPDIVLHPFAPVYDQHAKVLLLGTMASPKSRELGFYYMHPQNRFWRVMAAVLAEEIPASPEGKRALLLRRGIALWDVLQSCSIEGAGDASIREPVANDLGPILNTAQIRAVFTTGRAATDLYERCIRTLHPAYPPAHHLPSTSPANARCSLDELTEKYREIVKMLD